MIEWSDLKAVDGNWLIGKVGRDAIDQARVEANESVAFNALPNVFSDTPVQGWERRIRKAAVAFEIAASQILRPIPTNDEVPSTSAGTPDAPVIDQRTARASAYLAYDLLRALPPSVSGEAAMVDVLSRCALAYMGDRSTDLPTLLAQAETLVIAPEGWDHEVLSTLYRCWLTMFGKREQLSEVGPAIAALRERQGKAEAAYLDTADVMPAEQRALRLYALYNWARATELLAAFLRSGSDGSTNVETMLDLFFSDAQRWAMAAGYAGLSGLLQWLRGAASRMVSLSVWRAVRGDATRRFVERLAGREYRPLLEFLPPQRAALLDMGILESGRTAVVVDMPTSSGKTLLAEFRIIQTLTAYGDSKPWVAYVVPTRALAAQIVRRLRRELGPEYRIESLSAAVEIDSLEADLLAEENHFHVLVCTPEKLGTLVRAKSVKRPLRLVVVDEAHSISDGGSRGLGLELLLSTLRSETATDFMLLMPYVPNGKELAAWLARTPEDSSYADVSLSTTPWKPNDVLVGTFGVEGERRKWNMIFEPRIANRALTITRKLSIAKPSPLDHTASAVKNSGVKAAAAMAVAFYNPKRGVNLIMCPHIPDTWSAAKAVRDNLVAPVAESEAISLVRRFVQTEVGVNFELDDLLRHGIAVHHAGLPEEVRTLIEWLIENDELHTVCATSTIAQGMDFQVASVFLTSLAATGDDGLSHTMTARAFWNLAGRAGRVGQSAVGVVGVFKKDELHALDEILLKTGDELGSKLQELVAALQDAKLDTILTEIRKGQNWAEFRSFISHLVAQHGSDAVRADQLVRNTLGYRRLEANPLTNAKAVTLLEATRTYAAEVNPNRAKLADGTGFSPDAVGRVIVEMGKTGAKTTDWQPERLFSGADGSLLPRLIGAMMHVPQIREALKDFGGTGEAHVRIAKIASAWVRGKRIDEIAEEYFSTKDGKPVEPTSAVTAACRALYKSLAFAAPWGVSAIMQLPNSGLNFDSMSEDQRRQLNMLPAYLYHGVSTDEAVAMRINGVPRSIAQRLGENFRKGVGNSNVKITTARDWLAELPNSGWEQARHPSAALSASDYRSVWRILSPSPLPIA